MQKQKIKGEIYLLLAAFFWGTSFVFQKMGMDHVGPFTFGFFRFALGSLALIPVILVIKSFNDRKEKPKEITPFKDNTLIKGSLLCGTASFVAASFQQVGIVYTTAGKAGFITSLDIVIVPILLLLLRRKVGSFIWVGIIIAGFGLYLLCITDGFTIQLGDGLVMVCAVCYSFQILLIDHYAEKVDPIKLSFLQYALCSLLSGVFMLIFESVVISDIIDCAIPIIYTAIFEVSIAFTLQIVGQKYTPPAIAAIIMSMEAVFSAVAGALVLGEVMSMREISGCILMMIAFIVIQIPGKKSSDEKINNNADIS